MRKIIFTLIIVMTLFTTAKADDYIKQLAIGIDAVHAGEYIKAQEIFNLLIEKYPYRLEALCGLAIIDISTKSYKSARELLLKVIEKDAEFSQAYYLLALVEEHLLNYREALKYYRKYLDLVPNTPRKDKILQKINLLEDIKND